MKTCRHTKNFNSKLRVGLPGGWGCTTKVCVGLIKKNSPAEAFRDHLQLIVGSREDFKTPKLSYARRNPLERQLVLI